MKAVPLKEKLINRCCFKGLVLEKVQLLKNLLLCQMQLLGKTLKIEKAIVPCDVFIPDGTIIRSLDNEIILVTEEMLSGLYPAF